jgi:hypothetical protein
VLIVLKSLLSYGKYSYLWALFAAILHKALYRLRKSKVVCAPSIQIEVAKKASLVELSCDLISEGAIHKEPCPGLHVRIQF